MDDVSDAEAKVPRVPWRNFEGLFLGISISSALRAQLVALGVDPSVPNENLSGAAWRSVVGAVRAALYPALPEDVAEFKLGRAYFGGLAQLPFGEVLTEQMRSMAPESMLRMLAGQIKVVRPEMRLVIHALDERRWKYIATDQLGLPHFAAGSMQAALDLVAPNGRVELSRVLADGYELTFSW